MGLGISEDGMTRRSRLCCQEQPIFFNAGYNCSECVKFFIVAFGASAAVTKLPPVCSPAALVDAMARTMLTMYYPPSFEVWISCWREVVDVGHDIP